MKPVFRSALNRTTTTCKPPAQTPGRAVSDIGLNLEEQRNAFLSHPGLPGFSQLFNLPDTKENAIQQAVTSVPPEEQLVIVESETGSGKTEAALLRFARLYERGLVDGLYFALPTRAAASQIHGRVTAFVRNLYPADIGLEPVLAVPGYVRAGDATGKRLPNYDVWWDDHPDVRTEKRRWAAESTKRHLAAQNCRGDRGPGDDGRSASQARPPARRLSDAQSSGCRRSARFGHLHEHHP